MSLVRGLLWRRPNFINARNCLFPTQVFKFTSFISISINSHILNSRRGGEGRRRTCSTQTTTLTTTTHALSNETAAQRPPRTARPRQRTTCSDARREACRWQRHATQTHLQHIDQQHKVDRAGEAIGLEVVRRRRGDGCGVNDGSVAGSENWADGYSAVDGRVKFQQHQVHRVAVMCDDFDEQMAGNVVLFILAGDGAHKGT